jgi:hypothetical protein
LNEQPNAIADFAALTLNNFVSTVGRDYITQEDVSSIQDKAGKCGLTVNLSPESWQIVRKPQPLLTTLSAFDDAANIEQVNMATLSKLPLWDNFQRWENLVTIGLLYASDISHVDPVANARIREIMDNCNTLYK